MKKYFIYEISSWPNRKWFYMISNSKDHNNWTRDRKLAYRFTKVESFNLFRYMKDFMCFYLKTKAEFTDDFLR